MDTALCIWIQSLFKDDRDEETPHILRCLVFDGGLAPQILHQVAFPLPMKYDILVATVTAYLFSGSLREHICSRITSSKHGTDGIMRIYQTFTFASQNSGLFSFVISQLSKKQGFSYSINV